MGCDIVIRTWWRDLPWVRWCLEGVARFAEGFGEVILVVPRSSLPAVRRDLALPRSVRLEVCDDAADDYLGQQVTKLYADQLSDANLICHLDADMILCRRVRPEDLAPRGRPVIAVRAIGSMGRHYPWRACTEQFLGWSVPADFMQRPPFVYPRSLYPRIREHSRFTHGVELADYVLAQPPRGFSEFNTLGAYARRAEPEAFHWVDVDQGSPGPDWCRWYWSWEGLDNATRSDLAALLAGSSTGTSM